MQENLSLALTLRLLAKDRSDEDAWRSLYVALWPFVFANSFRSFRGMRDLAEDASQEVFLRMVRYCDFTQLQNPKIFRAYVRSMCANVSRTFIKQAAKYGTGSDEVSLESREYLSDSLPLPDEAAELNEFLDHVVADVEGSSIHKRIIGRIIQGYSLQEIASECGISYSAAAVRLHRLRHRLKAHLNPQK